MENLKNVKYLTSVAIAVNDVDDNVKHCQFVVVQDLETKELKCFFDIVDASKIKLADPDGLPQSDNA